MGSITCSDKPVDSRGTKLVPGTGLRSPLKLMGEPPEHWKLAAMDGQPKMVLLSWDTASGAIFNCDVKLTKSMPKSAKGASTTGPTILILYSALLMICVSPPGSVMLFTGIGIWILPRRGLVGSTGTVLPSGF